MQKKLKILVFGQSFLGKIGGVQQSYAWLYDYLCSKGHSVIHYTYLPIDGGGLYYKFPASVKVCCVNILFSSDKLNLIRNIAYKHDPDVILVVNSGSDALPFVRALRMTPYPVILSERGSPEYCLSHLWKSRRLYELATSCVEFKHFLMPSYPEILPRELRSRARVISSLTMPAQSFARPGEAGEKGRYTILYTGRFSSEKRLELLVDAFHVVAADFPLWDLLLAGEGPEWKHVQRLVDSYGLASRVILPGRVDSPESLTALYTGAHLFVLPSSHEGCPLALREAMAHALPVIGFASCSGTNQIIRHGRNGFLVSEDSAHALAQSLIVLMRQPTLRIRFGEMGKKDIEQFSPDRTHASWEALLYEGAAWKGQKRRLQWKRFWAHPWRSLCNFVQLWAVDKWGCEPWTGSLLRWLQEVWPFPTAYVILNSAQIPAERYVLPKSRGCEYSSPLIEYLRQIRGFHGRHQVVSEARLKPSVLIAAKNRLRLAMLHGINLHFYK